MLNFGGVTSWWFQISFLYVHPDPWGRWTNFDIRIFFNWVGEKTTNLVKIMTIEKIKHPITSLWKNVLFLYLKGIFRFRRWAEVVLELQDAWPDGWKLAALRGWEVPGGLQVFFGAMNGGQSIWKSILTSNRSSWLRGLSIITWKKRKRPVEVSSNQSYILPVDEFWWVPNFSHGHLLTNWDGRTQRSWSLRSPSASMSCVQLANRGANFPDISAGDSVCGIVLVGMVFCEILTHVSGCHCGQMLEELNIFAE